MKPCIVDQHGKPMKGTARFTYKDHIIVLDTMDDEPNIKVTIRDTLLSFTSMDDVISHVNYQDWKQYNLDHPT
jgi:hypothetical protein